MWQTAPIPDIRSRWHTCQLHIDQLHESLIGGQFQLYMTRLIDFAASACRLCMAALAELHSITSFAYRLKIVDIEFTQRKSPFALLQ